MDAGGECSWLHFRERRDDARPQTNILLIAGFGPIVRGRPKVAVLGIPFKEEGGGYLPTEALTAAKSFALWPLSQAAQLCFGKDSWPDDVPAPQAWLAFDVDSIDKSNGGA